LTRDSEGLIGLRIRLKLRHSDPRDSEELPSEWITGTIIGTYLDVFDRISYYVALDDAIEKEIETGAIRVVKRGEKGCADYHPTVGRVRRTNMIGIAASQDFPPPPQDILGPALLQLGCGTAEYVTLFFVLPLPSRITLEESQADSRLPPTEWKWDGAGPAEVEVVPSGGTENNHG
jgi:hypothetical protein